MPQQPERFDVLVLGSGTGGKLIAWHLAGSGQRTAVVERQWIGARVRTSPACRARMKFAAQRWRTWRGTGRNSAR